MVDLLNRQNELITYIYNTIDNEIDEFQEALNKLTELNDSNINPELIRGITRTLIIKLNTIKLLRKELSKNEKEII